MKTQESAEQHRLREINDTVLCLREFSLEDSIFEVSGFTRFLRAVALWAPFGIRVFYKSGGKRPYLLRIYLTPRWMRPGIYLHHFFDGDTDPAFHNHPWRRSLSLLLVNGYLEERPQHDEVMSALADTWLRVPGDLVVLRDSTFHRVTLHEDLDTGFPVRPWSLFIAGKRTTSDDSRSWMFWDRRTQRFHFWEAYLKMREVELRNEAKA